MENSNESGQEIKNEDEKVEEAKAFVSKVLIFIVLIGFMLYLLSGEDEPVEHKDKVESSYVANPTKIKIRSVGCENSDEISEATRDLMNGGLAAFVKHRDCIIVLKGEPIKVLDRGMFHTKVSYTLEGQSSRVLWIGSDVMEQMHFNILNHTVNPNGMLPSFTRVVKYDNMKHPPKKYK